MPQILDLGENGVHELPDDMSEQELQQFADSFNVKQSAPAIPETPKIFGELNDFSSPFPPAKPFNGAMPIPTPLQLNAQRSVNFKPEPVPSLLTEVPKQLFTMSPEARLNTENEIAAQANQTPFDASKEAQRIDEIYKGQIEALGDWTGNPEKIARANALAQWRDDEKRMLGFGLVDPFATPKMERVSPQQTATAFGLDPEGRAASLISSVQGTAAGIGEGFISPEGAVMLGGKAVPQAVKSSLATGFVGLMAKDAAAQTAEAIKKYADGDIKGGDAALAAAVTTAGMLGLPALAGKGPNKAKELAKLIEKGEFKPRLTADEAAQLRSRLTPRPAPPEMLAELQRTKELVDQAIQEATQKIAEPGKVPAIELLKKQNEKLLEVDATKQKPETGFERTAEEQMRGRTVAKKPEEVSNAVEQESTRPVQPLREEPIKGQEEVPTEINRGKVDEGGGQKEVSESDALQARGYTDMMREKLTPEEKAKALSEPVPTPQADAARYWEIQDKLKAEKDPAQKLKLYDEFGLESELIKNRNPESPGNPPERPAAPETTGTATEGGKTGVVSNAIQSGIDAIESLQSKLRKGSQSGDTLMGVPSAVLDTALEMARLALKAGKTTAQALEIASKHIAYNVKGINANDVSAKLSDVLKNEGILEAKKSAGKVSPKTAVEPPPTSPKEPQSGIQSPEGEKPRSYSARATASEKIPEPVQEAIKTDPRSSYEPQSVAEIKDKVKTMSDNDLWTVKADIPDNYVLAQAELADRAFAPIMASRS